MDVIEGDAAPSGRPLCLMIGNFDGVHRGHQAIIGQARALAEQHDCATAVLSFRPHPLKVLQPESAPPLLQTPAQKQALLAHHGVDFYIVQQFERQLYTLSPEDYVAHLRAQLNFRFLLVGFNFRFGHRRVGDTATLAALGPRHGFETHVVEALGDSHGPISSSRIRNLVAAGETQRAAELLGRPYFLEGVVGHGQQRGRELQTRTANLIVENELKPRFGVYASWCRLDDDTWVRAITNFGLAPTVSRGEALCETHLLDYAGELYGRHLVVTLGAFLRPERKFDDLDGLRRQIGQDVATRLELPDRQAPELPLRLGP